MNPPASLSSLPPEVVSKICSDPGLRKKDLNSLRLTSKAQGIHASASKAFGNLCFGYLPLLYTKYSLETFVKICQHPIFGPCVRTVVLSCARFDPEEFCIVVERTLPWHYDRRDFLEKIQKLVDRCEFEEWFEFRKVENLLDQAFSQLSKSNHDLRVAASTEERWSLGRSQTFPAEMHTFQWNADIPSALSLLLGSAKRAGCKVSTVDIIAVSRYFNSSSHHDLPDLLQSVSELTVDVEVLPRPDDADPSDCRLWIKDLLSWSVNLKVLDIDLKAFFDDDYGNTGYDFDALSQCISQMPLEELHLRGSYIHQETMIDLLENLGSTLRRLLTGCDIIGSWKEVLLSIQQNALQLDYLLIYARLCSSHGEGYKGTHSVRLGLEKMLQTIRVPDN